MLKLSTLSTNTVWIVWKNSIDFFEIILYNKTLKGRTKWKWKNFGKKF